MDVVITLEVFEDESHWDALSELMLKLNKGSHRWLLKKDVTAIGQSKFLQRDGHVEKRTKELLQKQFVHSQSSAKKKSIITVTPDPTRPDELMPAEALAILGEPLHVIVEDAESDSSILKFFSQKLSNGSLVNANRDGSLTFEHGGGRAGVEKAVKRQAERLGDKAYLRVFALVDSDRLYKEDTQCLPDQLIAFCEDQGIALMITEKREIENYIPDSCIKNWADKLSPNKRRMPLACLSSFTRLSDEQRDFYDMKSGFTKIQDSKDERQKKHLDLFSDLLDEKKLQTGFGDKVWQSLDRGGYKMNAREFRHRSNPGVKKGHTEIEKILKEIERRI